MELSSKVETRRNDILEYIKHQGRISLQEIIERFQCSEATARRDLDILEKSGQIIRTIGGAIYEGGNGNKELPFSDKKLVYWNEKEQIAELAVGLIKEGDIVCLTGGTTTYLIAKALKQHKKQVTVVTNAVNIAYELSDSEDFQVVLTGGVMRHKSYELCGPLAEKVIEEINISKMFVGADGVTQEQGFTMYSQLENRIAQQLMNRSKKTYFVFDHSKLGKSTLFTIAPLSKVYGVITDREPDAAFMQACQVEGLEVYFP
jgi:DeoR/GlpR family transcriptional regulator of sugar metabolism